MAYFPVAKKLKLYDIPNERSSHSNIAIRGGGILIPFSFTFYSIFFDFQYLHLYLGVVIVSVISFLDDYKGANVLLRLICHFFAVGLMMVDIPAFSSPLNSNVYLPLYFMIIAIVAVAAINAYNFMDGINAITGLYTLSVYGTLLYYNYAVNSFMDSNILVVLTVALLLFGFFNFRTRATLFAGDIGSVSLGLISVFLVLNLIDHNNNDLIYLSMLSVYGVESGLTIFYRLYKRQNIFQAHRIHLFQDLVHKVGFSHLKTSIIYTVLQILINIGMFAALYLNYPGYIYFIYVITLLVGFYIILKFRIHKQYDVTINEED